MGNLHGRMATGSQKTQISGPTGTVVGVTPDGKIITQTAFQPGTVNSFGQIMTGTVNNQVDIQFYRSDGSVADIVTETNANGGTATASNGMATFSATSTANSRAKGVSLTNTTYTANSEIYCVFTAGFTGSGAGTSYQRIGLYDGNDGFFLGYEGGTFGVTTIKGGVKNTTNRIDFNKDKLSGENNSLFMRADSPEAIDLTKLNVWRIRFGWVGSAPIEFEVLSPDGNWVTFHQVKQPNLAAFPSINTADLPVTCDVNSGNSGQALTIITNCWVAGTTQSLQKINTEITEENLATLSRSVITGETTAGGGGFVNVKVSPSGALEAEANITDIEDGTGDSIMDGANDAMRVNMVAGGLSLPNYDYVSMALSAGDTTETYTFKTGGSGGTTVATVVVVYTTSAREVLSSVTKS